MKLANIAGAASLAAALLAPVGARAAGVEGDQLAPGAAQQNFGLPSWAQNLSLSGNTTKLATVSGTLINGHVPVADANGNLVDSGVVPGGGGGTGSGTVNTGAAQALAVYTSATAAVSPLTLGTNVYGALTAAAIGTGSFLLSTNPTITTPTISGNVTMATDNTYSIGAASPGGNRIATVYALQFWAGNSAANVTLAHSKMSALAYDSTSTLYNCCYINYGFTAVNPVIGTANGDFDFGVMINGVAPAPTNPGAHGIFAMRGLSSADPNGGAVATLLTANDNDWDIGQPGQGFSTAYLHNGLMATTSAGLTVKASTGATIGTFAAGAVNITGTFTATGEIASVADLRAQYFTSIAAQGAYLQWNRNTNDGATWLVNQKGVGSGGINLGEATASNAFTLTANFNPVSAYIPEALQVSGSFAPPASLYMYCGAPGNCNGIWAGTATDVQAYGGAGIWDEVIIDSTTHRSYTSGENGLWVNFNVNSGYTAPPYTNALDRAGFQISAFGSSGGGQAWASAMSLTLNSGWAGASGNFGVGIEIDPDNEATASTDVLHGGNTFIIGEWLAGPIGAYPITDYLQISPVSNNGTHYGAHYGILFYADYLTDEYTIFDDSNTGAGNIASYVDAGKHQYGASYGGTYSVAAINIGTAAIAIAATSGDKICLSGNAQCVKYNGASINFDAGSVFSIGSSVGVSKTCTTNPTVVGGIITAC